MGIKILYRSFKSPGFRSFGNVEFSLLNFGTVFKSLSVKPVNMEMRNDSNKRKRKTVQRQPVLVRSVKPGQASVQAWERKNTSVPNLWNFGTSAA